MKTTVALSGVPETMLIPLYARAVESKKPNPVIGDFAAIDLVNKIDYDFTKFDKGKMSIWGCVARTIIFDREVKKYIDKNPNCVCINIGCGLDTRFRRVDNGTITWFNLDLQSVIDIRKELLPDMSRETSIAESVLDSSWVKKIPKNDNVVVIIEGLLMYFTEKEVKGIFSTIRKSFPNATVFAELSSTVMVKNQKRHDVINETNAKFKWGIKKSKDVEKMCSYMKLVDEWNLTNEMRRFSPVLISIMMLFKNFNNRIAKFVMVR